MKTGFSGGIAQRFLNSKLTPLLTAFSLVLGIGAVMSTPREEEPQIRVPMIDVAVGMPGATPKEVERRLVEPLERAVWEVADVEYVYSVAQIDGAMVTARFKVGTEPELALTRLYGKLMANMDKMPAGTTPPFVTLHGINEVPILTLTLSGGTDAGDGYLLRQQAVELAAELKRGKMDELTRILEEQLAQVQRELQGAENELESFKVRTVTLPSEETGAIAPGLQQTRDPVLSDFFSRRLELERVLQDLGRLQAILDSIPADGVRVESYELIPAVQSSSQLRAALGTLTDRRAELRSLLQRYTEDYQPVKDLQNEIRDLETVTLPRLTRSLEAELSDRATELRTVLNDRASELEEIPPRAIEEARLERRVAIADRLYTDLRQRYETARLASASSIPDIRILDNPRVPSVPASDTRIQLAGMLFLGFLGAGIALALLLDRADPRFRYLSDVSEDLGIEILGVVPRLETGRKENSTQVFEAFRDIRMRCEFAHGTSRPIVLAVTSPDTGEGKTFVSANLGISFAQLGRATLLVDGDTRRGDLHELFDHERKPGLTELLEGRVRNSVIRRTQHENLDLLSSGSRRAASPELLSSGRMQQMLAALKPRYDVIILDCPPMAAGSDAFVLGAHTGNVVLVLRSGTTHKDLAKGKMETFLRLPVRILGGVLNDIKEGEGDFGSYRYYSYYLPDYVTREDELESGSREEPSNEDVDVVKI